jgi:hypothetical protein
MPLFLLLLAGCDRAQVPAEGPDDPAGTPAACALNGSDALTDCQVIRTTGEDGVTLTMIAPDGGFRRLAVAADGGTITTADGAQPARVGRGPGGEVEVAVAGDRYRLPAAQP